MIAPYIGPSPATAKRRPAVYTVGGSLRYSPRRATRGVGHGRAVGVERTTRHAFAAPRGLGSIRARGVRRRVTGTGPFRPLPRARAPPLWLRATGET